VDNPGIAIGSYTVKVSGSGAAGTNGSESESVGQSDAGCALTDGSSKHEAAGIIPVAFLHSTTVAPWMGVGYDSEMRPGTSDRSRGSNLRDGFVL